MTRRLIAGVLLAAGLAAACSSDSSPTSPTGSGRSRGAVITGRVTGMSSRAASSDTATTMATSRVTVTVVGTDISTVVDGGGEFTLTGVPPGDVQLRFVGQGVSATVTLTGVSATDRITVTIALNGNAARLEAERRQRDDDDDDDDDGDVERQGAVSNLSGLCPALTFTVQGTTVRTNSMTRFSGGPCTRIANGIRVEVEGPREFDGSIFATEVEIDD